MNHVKLWQFNLATFLATQVLFGVEGWGVWAIVALVAWFTTRRQSEGAKNFTIAGVMWLGFAALMHWGR